MTYDPTKPVGEISPKDQVVQVETNFEQFATIFNVNHTAFNDPNQGDHETILFEIQTDDPVITKKLDALYAKNATSKIDTQPQLFLRIPVFLPTNKPSNPDSPGNPPMQLTYNEVNTAGPIYQSFLPGGYLLYFGSTNNIAVPVILSPAPTQILAVIVNPNNLTTSDGIPFDVSTSPVPSFTDRFMINSTLNGSGPVVSYTFNWMAIAIA